MPYIEIGDNVQITKDCIILGHDYSYSVCAKALDIVPRQQKITKIGNNVFLGMRSIILMGAEIGDNTIIGAGSVVHGKIESDSVYAGNPAKKIASLNRYMEKYIEILTDSCDVVIKNFKNKNGRFPTLSELDFYSALFTEDKTKYMNNANYNAIKEMPYFGDYDLYLTSFDRK